MTLGVLWRYMLHLSGLRRTTQFQRAEAENWERQVSSDSYEHLHNLTSTNTPRVFPQDDYNYNYVEDEGNPTLSRLGGIMVRLQPYFIPIFLFVFTMLIFANAFDGELLWSLG